MTTVKFKHPVSNSFNNLVDDFFKDFSSIYRDDLKTSSFKHVPVNIKESEGGYQIEIVAPGFNKEDFNVKLDNNLLTISADVKKEEKETEKYLRREFSFSSFSKTFTLDETIDSEKIEGKYNNGVLIVTLFKKAEVKAPVKQISIQ